MQTIILNVDGMSCKHCEKAIKTAVRDIEGVRNIKIDLNKKTVKVIFDNIKTDENTIKNTITETGYTVVL